MSDTYRDLTMPPVIGGAGAPYSTPDSQKELTLPPTIGGTGSAGEPATQRDLELPPVVT